MGMDMGFKEAIELARSNSTLIPDYFSTGAQHTLIRKTNECKELLDTSIASGLNMPFSSDYG